MKASCFWWSCWKKPSPLHALHIDDLHPADDLVEASFLGKPRSESGSAENTPRPGTHKMLSTVSRTGLENMRNSRKNMFDPENHQMSV